MTTLPSWFQILVGLVGVIGFVGAAVAFLFVIWPSIRRQNRLGRRLEEWLEGDDAKKLTTWLRNKIDLGGDVTTREAFLSKPEKGGL